jgi:hypothetical protein
MAMTQRTASICGALVMSVVGIAAVARPTPAAPAAAPVRVPAEIGSTPVLTHVPSQATIDPDRPTIVSLGVDRLAAGASVRLESDAYVYTFGRVALTASGAHVVDLAITGVQPGAYMVSISNPDGRRSGALPLVLKAR